MTDQTQSASAEEGQPLLWRGDYLDILDQRLLPGDVRYIQARDAATAAQAIKDLAVRGAPAIGLCAAYGLVLAARRLSEAGTQLSVDALRETIDQLAAARPTAVNLVWALQRLRRRLGKLPRFDWTDVEAEALAIHEEERQSNRQMARIGAKYIAPGSRVLTVCNTGGLATGGTGTALAVIVEAWRQGRIEEAFAVETRPWFQGARLTTWELQRAGVPHRLIVDSAVNWLMKTQGIDWVIVGADRVAANGDVANKIGTYAAAVAARAHGAKTMVVIPMSTLDMDTASGADIPIEERDPLEITAPAGRPLAPLGTRVWNPVFDVTPASHVDVLVTERGAVEKPDYARLQALSSASGV